MAKGTPGSPRVVSNYRHRDPHGSAMALDSSGFFALLRLLTGGRLHIHWPGELLERRCLGQWRKRLLATAVLASPRGSGGTLAGEETYLKQEVTKKEAK